MSDTEDILESFNKKIEHNTECLICFSAIESSLFNIRCSNNECIGVICKDCLEDYIKFCKNNNQKPKCVNSSCNGEYLFSKIHKEIRDDYLFIIEKMRNQTNSEFSNTLNYKSSIEKFKKDRRDFINKTFPKAITKLIEISLYKKVNKINKDNMKLINSSLSKSNRRCFNIVCRGGFLDKDLKCNTCDKQFCKECEAMITPGKIHICDENDVKSVKSLQDFICCPKCYSKIERSFGCNHMTCSICRTKFDYVSGSVGGVTSCYYKY